MIESLPEIGGGRWSLRLGLAALTALAVASLAAPWLAPADPLAVSHEVLHAPSLAHFFGTDDLGRDVFSGVLHGARAALVVGVSSAVLALVTGLLLGGVAGLAGGLADEIVMRGVEFFQAFPRLFLVIVVVTLFGQQLLLVAVLIGLTYWPSTARLARGQVLAVKHEEYVLAARAAGASMLRTLLHHVVPAVLPPVVTLAALHAGGAVLVEAGLSFLGLSDPGVTSWGAMLTDAHHYMRTAWWVAVFPGLAIAATVLAWALVADGLLDRRGATEARRSPLH